jgi:uncharacterized protein YcaQ
MVLDGIAYLWPAGQVSTTMHRGESDFLAPFDPLVWDRTRFEHFWGWPYRFEAYTPVANRVRGYYALPMLWGDRVIGWTNIKADAKGMNIEIGFVTKPAAQRAFRSELGQEIESFKTFLNLASVSIDTLTWT